MAGSYRHVIDNSGGLGTPRYVLSMLETNSADVYEAVEEMYGMIHYLAALVVEATGAEHARIVEDARCAYKTGLLASPTPIRRRWAPSPERSLQSPPPPADT